MKLIGLTGGISTGKSTVSNLLKEMGAVVIDSDKIARAVLDKGTPAHNKIVETFGKEVLKEDGWINRERLGEIVFADPAERKKLDKITHPATFKGIFKEILRHSLSGKVVALDSPLLFETRIFTRFTICNIVVTCNEPAQLQRLIKRNGFTEEVAKNRIKSQMPLAKKEKLADYVIDNNGGLDQLEVQTKKLYEETLQRLWPSGTFTSLCLAGLGLTGWAVSLWWS